MKKLYARMNDCKQYSEEAWEAIVHIKEITGETTINDLIEWQQKIFYPGNDFLKKALKQKDFPQIFISEGE